MLGQVVAELVLQLRLVGGELVAVAGGEVDRVLVRDVDARHRHVPVVVHLLHQLACELDRLDVRAERAAEHALEERFELRFDAAEDGHRRRGCYPGEQVYVAPLEGQDRGGQPGRGHEREQRGGRSDRRGEAQQGSGEEHGGPRPAPAGVREGSGGSREDERLGGDLRVRDELAPERVRDGGRPGRSRQAEAERRRRAVERQRDAADPGDDGREQDGGGDLQRAPRAPVRRLRDDRQQRERGERRGERPGREQEPGARVAPVQRGPEHGERGVHDREAGRDVREREERGQEREQQPGARRGEAERRRRRPRARAASRRDRTGARRRPSPEATPASAPGRMRSLRDLGRATCGGAAGPGAAAVLAPAPRQVPQLGGEALGRRPALRVRDERAVDRVEDVRAAGRGAASRGAARPAGCCATSPTRSPPQNGCSPASASQRTTPSPHTSAADVAGSPCSRSGEM